MVGHIQARVAKLKASAVERYGVAADQCHVGHLILEGLLENPTKVSQIDAATDAVESCASLALRSMRLASALHNSGLRSGSTVLLIARGALDMAIVFYACHYMGYTFCSIDPEVDVGDMKRLYPNLKPELVFTISYAAEKNAAALEENRLAAPTVVFEDKDNDLDAFIRNHNGTEIDFSPAVGFDTARTTAWLMLTSGTTGPPKAAIVPYDHVLHALIEWWDGLPEVASNMILTSTQWLTSIIYTASAPLKSLVRIQSSQPMNPQILMHMINKYRPETTAWTPFLLARFVQGPRNVCDLTCFRYILVGGGSVDQHIVQELKKICPAKLVLGYGMTELLTKVFNYIPDASPIKSSGKPICRYQCKLVDDKGRDITEPNAKGELWVKGYGFFTGYLGDEEETRKVLRPDGWLMTGDIFYRDEDNNYFYSERKKLLVRYLTFFISPLEIEAVIKQHPGVSEACVVGYPNPATMELATAAILRKNGHRVDPQEIFDLVKRELPPKKHLHGGIFFVDFFPTTVSAKVNRKQVLQIAKSSERIMDKS